MAALRPEVLFFAPYAGPLLADRAGVAGGGSTGGAETQLFLVAQALQRRGRRVALAVADLPLSAPDVVDGIEIVRLPPFARGGQRFVRALAAARDIDAEVVVQRAAGSFTGLVGVPTRLRRRRFVYSTASDLDFTPDLLGDGIVAPRLFRLGVRSANAIVVQTDAQAELCRTRWKRPCTVIRSVAEPAPPRSAGTDAFLWIGRMNANKRPEAVVELAARLPDARFQMVVAGSRGDSELERSVRKRAATLPNVELLGPQTRDGLAPLLDRAVAVLSTSHAEGMPNVLLEGWARGVPALVLSHDPDGLVRRRALGWSAEGSIDGLVALAGAAWSGRGDQAELSARCRAYVAGEHAPDLIAAQWEGVLGLSRRAASSPATGPPGPAAAGPAARPARRPAP